MGDITLISEGIPNLLPSLHRTPGLHVGAIVTDLALTLGLLDDDTELSTTWAQLGCALEDSIAVRLEQDDPGRYVRPGELCVDNIYGHPDIIDTIDDVPEEIKLSWMSSEQPVDGNKFWRYWTQLKCYRRMWGEQTGDKFGGLQVARLRVTHVNGDYKRGGGTGPVSRLWERRWTRQEIAETWAMVRSHGEKNRERLEEGREVA